MSTKILIALLRLFGLDYIHIVPRGLLGTAHEIDTDLKHLTGDKLQGVHRYVSLALAEVEYHDAIAAGAIHAMVSQYLNGSDMNEDITKLLNALEENTDAYHLAGRIGLIQALSTIQLKTISNVKQVTDSTAELQPTAEHDDAAVSDHWLWKVADLANQNDAAQGLVGVTTAILTMLMAPQTSKPIAEQMADQLLTILGQVERDLQDKAEKQAKLPDEWRTTLEAILRDQLAGQVDLRAPIVLALGKSIEKMAAIKASMVPPLSTLLWTMAQGLMDVYPQLKPEVKPVAPAKPAPSAPGAKAAAKPVRPAKPAAVKPAAKPAAKKPASKPAAKPVAVK